jgi:hypothetical protein
LCFYTDNARVQPRRLKIARAAVGCKPRLAGPSKYSPVSISAKPVPEEEHQLLAEFGLVPDVELGVDTQPHDEPNHLWGVEPPKPIALLANRKIVFMVAVAAKPVRHDVIGGLKHFSFGSQ